MLTPNSVSLKPAAAQLRALVITLLDGPSPVEPSGVAGFESKLISDNFTRTNHRAGPSLSVLAFACAFLPGQEFFLAHAIARTSLGEGKKASPDRC